MKNSCPMVDGGPIFRLYDFMTLGRRVLLKIKGEFGDASAIDISDNKKDRNFSFVEYPLCELCGSTENRPVMTAMDGNSIVECGQCGLWYTSPRVPENEWMEWLLSDSDRNRKFTENRLHYGVALERNIRFVFSFWWRITRARRQHQVQHTMKLHRGKVKRIFDVGCGCGYFMKAAEDMGIEVSGNDLNGYAINRMKELFGFDVYAGVIADLVANGDVEKNEYDVVYMNDYIEHSYHPNSDFEAAYEILRDGGILYVKTFCIDSEKFKRLGERWDMLMWNHCYHFTSNSLVMMMENVGLKLVSCRVWQEDGLVELWGKKNDRQRVQAEDS